jgi:hypothetical protein
MDAVTYPQASVQELLREQVAFAHVNQKEPGGFAGILDRAPAMWTPTFLLADRAGRHIRRWVGFLPPDDYLNEIRLGLAMHHLLRRRPEDALLTLAPLLDADDRSTPEAFYWAGVADYRIANDKRALLPRWDELVRRFPDSTWALRADCLETLR